MAKLYKNRNHRKQLMESNRITQNKINLWKLKNHPY